MSRRERPRRWPSVSPMSSLPGAEHAFAPDPASVVAARRFLADQLHRWDREDVLWTALQVVSELATNCVLHAHTAFLVTVCVLPDGALRLEVTDEAAAAPHLRHYGVDATTGRGIRLVAGLARSWGVEERPSGKVVWCEMSNERKARDGVYDEHINLDAFLTADDWAAEAAEMSEPRVPSAAPTPITAGDRRLAVRVAA